MPAKATKARKGRKVSHTDSSIVPPVQIQTSPLSQMWFISLFVTLWDISKLSDGCFCQLCDGCLNRHFRTKSTDVIFLSADFQQWDGKFYTPPIMKFYILQRSANYQQPENAEEEGSRQFLSGFDDPGCPDGVFLFSLYRQIICFRICIWFCFPNILIMFPKQRGHCLSRCPCWARPPLHTLCFWSCLWGNHLLSWIFFLTRSFPFWINLAKTAKIERRYVEPVSHSVTTAGGLSLLIYHLPSSLKLT